MRAVDRILPLYLVTDVPACLEAGLVETVRNAAAAGVTAVQLRDPAADERRLGELGTALLAVLRPRGIPLIVNDHPQVCVEIGADGVHVGQGDTDAAEARAVIGPDRLLGLSVQTVAHVEAALTAGVDVDYLGVGPVWPTASKPDAAPPGGVDRLASVVRRSPWPCLAIGGVTRTRVPEVRRTGAAGVAVVSAICGRPDVTAATKALRRAWEETR